jgi:hypothetical protein
MKSIILVLSVLLAGCAIPITDHVKDWPELRVRVHENTSQQYISDLCTRDWSLVKKLLVWPIYACTYVDLQNRTCDVYIPGEAEGDIFEHELEHCRGGDHGGTLQELLNTYNKRNG